MRRLVVTLTVSLLMGTAVAQTAPTMLRDGQQVTLTGRLTMEPAGRLQFVTVKTEAAYMPVFKGDHGKEQPGELLHEIGLAGYHDYTLLYAHRGQPVTVTGKLATDEATPYFFHGTRLQVSSIRLMNGTDLLQSRGPARESIAADTGTYDAKAMLPADLAAPWVYSANGQQVEDGRFLSCSSNGGGDVVNCFCAKGFHAVSGQSNAGGTRAPARVFQDGSTAQFEAGDDKHTVELSVTCSR